MTKGPLELRRTYPDVSIRVSAGTHSKRQLHILEAMCRQLYEAGRLDYLRLVRDQAITPMALYDRLRGKDYHFLPPPMVERLSVAVERVLGFVDGSHAWKKNLKSYWKRMAFVAGAEATVEDVPAAVKAVRQTYAAEGQAQAFNHFRASALTLLRETVGRRSPIYADVQDIKRLAASPKREPQPLTPVEAWGVAEKLGKPLGACWLTACLTGMGRKEYAGQWSIEGKHLRVRGTKRAGRDRLVPLVAPVTPLPCAPRFLHEAIVTATKGRVQFYDARRTFTKWLEQAGVIPAHQDAYTGHGARSQTDWYKRGNITPYLDADAALLRAFLRNALETAGVDAGGGVKKRAIRMPLLLDGSSDAPRRSRTPNLLIRSQSPERAHKRKYSPNKGVGTPHTSRNAPEPAKTMRGRVRGVGRATSPHVRDWPLLPPRPGVR